MPDQHKNFATSLVATAPSPATSGTSLVVTGTEGARFPTVPFNATICPATADATPANAEVVRVTGIATDTLTITRATEGSVARTVVVGDRIYAGVTAKTLTDVEADLALASAQYAPTGVTYQNYTRYMTNIAVTGAALTSGTLKMCGIWLPAGVTVTSIVWCSGTTALTTSGSGPHAWAALFDSTTPRGLLRQSTDDTAATWSASSLKTFTLSSTFVTTYAGLHYAGLMLHCGSTGTLPSIVTSSGVTTGLTALAPVLAGNSSSSQTGTAPNPAAAITAAASLPWCGVA